LVTYLILPEVRLQKECGSALEEALAKEDYNGILTSKTD